MTPASVELSSLIVVAAFRFCDGVHSSQHVVVVAALGDAPNSGVTSVRVRERSDLPTVSCWAAGLAQHCCGGRARSGCQARIGGRQPLSRSPINKSTATPTVHPCCALVRLHLNVLDLTVTFFFFFS